MTTTDHLRRSQVATSRPLSAQLRSFVAIGVASTLAWAVLYTLLRTWLSPVAANAIALVVSAVGNTAANRRLTFGVQGRAGLARDHGAGLLAFALALALTTAAWAGLAVVAPHAGRLAEVAVLIAANAVATGGRFVLLRAWLGRRASVPT
jgi:putative flippase GtrA